MDVPDLPEGRDVECKAEGCGDFRMGTSDHCARCRERLVRLYLGYKDYQRRQVKPLMDKNVSELELLTNKLLIRHYGTLEKLYDMRISYRNIAYKKCYWDKGHSKFLSSIIDRMMICESILERRVEEYNSTLKNKTKPAIKRIDKPSQGDKISLKLIKTKNYKIKNEEFWDSEIPELIDYNRKLHEDNLSYYNDYLKRANMGWLEFQNGYKDEFALTMYILLYTDLYKSLDVNPGNKENRLESIMTVKLLKFITNKISEEELEQRKFQLFEHVDLDFLREELRKPLEFNEFFNFINIFIHFTLNTNHMHGKRSKISTVSYINVEGNEDRYRLLFHTLRNFGTTTNVIDNAIKNNLSYFIILRLHKFFSSKPLESLDVMQINIDNNNGVLKCMSVIMYNKVAASLLYLFATIHNNTINKLPEEEWLKSFNESYDFFTQVTQIETVFIYMAKLLSHYIQLATQHNPNLSSYTYTGPDSYKHNITILNLITKFFSEIFLFQQITHPTTLSLSSAFKLVDTTL